MIGSGGGPVAAECGPTGHNFSKGMQGRAGQGMAGQGGQGKAGRARQGRAGQGRAGQARAGHRAGGPDTPQDTPRDRGGPVTVTGARDCPI